MGLGGGAVRTYREPYGGRMGSMRLYKTLWIYRGCGERLWGTDGVYQVTWGDEAIGAGGDYGAGRVLCLPYGAMWGYVGQERRFRQRCGATRSYMGL